MCRDTLENDRDIFSETLGRVTTHTEKQLLMETDLNRKLSDAHVKSVLDDHEH